LTGNPAPSPSRGQRFAGLIASILLTLPQRASVLFRPLYWWYERRLDHRLHADARLPEHLGLILDGNRRFARAEGLAANLGHSIGAQKAYDVLDWCLEVGIAHVTLWVFSTDNASRDDAEVAHLYNLFAAEARRMAEDPRIHRNRVKVRVIGDLSAFPERARQSLANLEAVTADYRGMQLYMAMGYGGREEILTATRQALRKKSVEGMTLEEAVQALTVDDISRHLYAAPCPDPDFIIRTSGEIRLSGFLLWQSAYSEYYFCDVYWPAFRKVDFLRALRSYQLRQRRFGR